MLGLLCLLYSLFSPFLGSNDHRQIKHVFLFWTKISAFLATIIGSVLLIYGRPLIAAWMGNSYLDAFWPLLILTTGIFFDVAQPASVSYLYGVYRHKFLAYATLVEGIANAILSIHLARKYGMIGVALGTAIPMIVMKLLVQPLYVCRSIGVSLWDYYFRVLARVVATTGLAVGIPALLLYPRRSAPNLVIVVALVGIQALIAAAAGYFAVFSKDERQAIVASLLRACGWNAKETIHLVTEVPRPEMSQ